MDGYIKDASIKLLDLTSAPNNGYPIKAETITDNYGNYKFDQVPAYMLPNIYEVQLLSGGTDITNNKIVNTNFSIITTTSESPTGVVNITPITTLVAELTKKKIIEYISTNGSIDESNISTILSESKEKISTLFDINENDLNQNFITTENTTLAKKAIQVNTTIEMLKNSINDDEIDNNNILDSFIEEINATDESSTQFDLSDSSKIGNIITKVADSNSNVSIPLSVKENISDYASTINNDIEEIDSGQSITKVLTATTKLAIASTELLTDEENKPDFTSTIDMIAIKNTIDLNKSKVLVANVDVIGGKFIFKISVSSYYTRNKALNIMNNNRSFTKLVTTISDIDTNDNNRITVSTEYEFKPRGKDYDGFACSYPRDTTFEIVKWGKIPISKAVRGDGWGQQFNLFYGTITATDTPTIQLGTNFKAAFQNSHVTNIPNMHLWDISKVINMNSMFYWAQYFNADISTWDTSRVTDMGSMFYKTALFNCGLNKWYQDDRRIGQHRQNINTKEVTVNGKTYIAWNVSKITNLFEMFYGASGFNNDISNWNTSNVIVGSAIFQSIGFNCGNGHTINPNDTERGGLPERTIDTKMVTIGTDERQITYKAWDVSRIKDMRLMFKGTHAFNNDLNNWNMINVTRTLEMFKWCPYTGDISKWNTSGLVNAQAMFREMSNFNIDISTKTIDVTHPDNYLPTYDYSGQSNSSDAPIISSIRNPDLPDSYVAWDVTGISNMKEMIASSAFRQNIRNWNVQEGTNTTNMFTTTTVNNNDFELTSTSPTYDWFSTSIRAS